MVGELWDMPNQQVVRPDSVPAAQPKAAQAEPAAVVDNAGPAQYDPGEHTVDEVKAYVTAMPGTAQSVKAAEQNGKARSTLLEWLEEL